MHSIIVYKHVYAGNYAVSLRTFHSALHLITRFTGKQTISTPLTLSGTKKDMHNLVYK